MRVGSTSSCPAYSEPIQPMLAMAYSLQSSIQLLSSYAAYATEGLNHRQEQQLCGQVSRAGLASNYPA